MGSQVSTGRLFICLIPLVAVGILFAVMTQPHQPERKASPSEIDWQSAFSYFLATSPRGGPYGVVGSDTWTSGIDENDRAARSNARAYLCDPKRNSVVDLQIPRIDGSNKNVIDITEPVFASNGRWLCATLHTKTGAVYAVAWLVRTHRPYMLGKIDGHYKPQNDVAREYIFAPRENLSPKTVSVDEHSISIGDHDFYHAWIRDCTPGWPVKK